MLFLSCLHSVLKEKQAEKKTTQMHEDSKFWLYVAVFILFAGFFLFVINRIPLSSNPASVPSGGSSKLSQIETMGFDETEVNADVAVIAFRIQAFAQDEEQKARLEFLRTLQEIETQCNHREIPFQLFPKSKEPFVFVSSSFSNPLPTSPMVDALHAPTSPSRTKFYSITQDFSLPLLLSRSPPIPLFLDTLASHGALISNISFPISAERKMASEKASLLKAVADAKSKASFLATEQQRTLGHVLEINPVNIKIEQVKDSNLDLLLGQLDEQQKKFQQQMHFEKQQREQFSNPYAMMVNPLLQMQQQQSLPFSGFSTVTPATPTMDPLKIFSSALVPKKVMITTQVRVKFSCM